MDFKYWYQHNSWKTSTTDTVVTLSRSLMQILSAVSSKFSHVTGRRDLIWCMTNLCFVTKHFKFNRLLCTIIM